METVSREELKVQFTELGVQIDEDVLDVCCELCVKYGLGEADLVESWIAYSFSTSNGALPTLDNIRAFERVEFINKKKPSMSKTSYVPIFSAADNNSPIRNSLPNNKCKTPNYKNSQENFRLNFSPAGFSPDIYTPSTKYSSRKNSGQVLATAGKSLFNWESKSQNMNVKEYRETNSKDWKYFYSTLRNMSLIIEDSSMELAQAILKHHSLPDPSPITNQTEETVFIGRICPIEKNKPVFIYDLCSNDDGKEDSTKELDLTNINEFTLFPGQVVAIKGTAVSNKVVATEIFSSAPLPLPPPPSFSGNLEICVAAGPMTLSDTLSYEPFQDLVNYVIKNKPNILIIIGPILDSNHVKITEDGVAETFSDYFTRLIKQMEESFQNINIQVFIISNSKDAMNIPVYPTPIPSSNNFSTNIKFYPDPCIIDINGLIVGITSTDLLLHLGKYELSKIQSNRLGVLAGQLINQRSFYPLWPNESDFVFELNLWQKYSRLPVTPHILIMPSDLHCFLKETAGCLIVNPGRLTKGMVGGTFSCIEILSREEPLEWKTDTHIAAINLYFFLILPPKSKSCCHLKSCY